MSFRASAALAASSPRSRAVANGPLPPGEAGLASPDYNGVSYLFPFKAACLRGSSSGTLRLHGPVDFFLGGFVLPRLTALVAVLALPGCALAGRGARSGALPLPAGYADSLRTERIAEGAFLHTLVNLSAPWRAYVLDVDTRCATAHALKGSARAVGRRTTSALLAGMPADSRAIAAINADFFLFAPPGVPTNLHLEHGRVVAGPGGRPVFATDGAGRYVLDTIRAEGTITGRERALQLRAWNRPDSGRSGIVDGNWGVPLDSAIRRGVQRLDPSAVTGRGTEIAGRYVVRASTPADTLVHGDTLLLHLADGVPPLPPGDTVLLSLRLAGAAGIALREAVGGRPLLVADSAVTGDVDTEGNAGFRGLNPRSAVGMNRQGTRIWFAVIDGRRPGYSMGMTLRQTAELMRALGATRALNLDGGGSSALALRDPVAGRVNVVNRPSDATERPV